LDLSKTHPAVMIDDFLKLRGRLCHALDLYFAEAGPRLSSHPSIRILGGPMFARCQLGLLVSGPFILVILFWVALIIRTTGA